MGLQSTCQGIYDQPPGREPRASSTVPENNPPTLPPAMPSHKRSCSVREAAELCGYVRPNTFREKFLSTPEAREKFGVHYDARGRLMVDRRAVQSLRKRLESERAERGNWRPANLGDWARPRRRRPRRTETPEKEPGK
jgi:hypothetical protein